tara:strand:+ start:1676 stop:2014 length:339 start_codon:yes stop_codon:yes gene_type:complete
LKIKKNNSAYKTISEVSLETKIPMHVLRFWENKFGRLTKVRRQKGHRYYNQEDIIFILKIKKLIYTDGYTIKGVQNYLTKNKVVNKENINDNKHLDLLYEIRDEINILIRNN